jgi:hypothetical protein
MTVKKIKKSIIPGPTLIEALYKHDGNLVNIAKEYNVNYMTIYRRVTRDEEMNDIYESYRKLKNIEIEDALFAKAKGGDVKAQEVWLKAHEKEKYGDKKTIDVNSKSFNVNIDVQKELSKVPIEFLISMKNGEPITKLLGDGNEEEEIIDGEEIIETDIESGQESIE